MAEEPDLDDLERRMDGALTALAKGIPRIARGARFDRFVGADCGRRLWSKNANCPIGYHRGA